MRIGVDATCWQNNRGYGRHARALLRALLELDSVNEYVFFMDSEDCREPVSASATVRLVKSSRPTTVAASAVGNRSLRDMWRMGRAMADRTLDILLFPTIYSYVPVISRSKKIVMIHDIIAEKFPSLTMPKLRSRLLWNIKVALGRYQASALVTVSEHSRRGIVDHFRVKPETVFVVGEASDPVFRVIESPSASDRLRQLNLDGAKRDIVYVGGFSPHKNLEMLVDAFAAICQRPEMLDVRLVLVGEFEKEVFHSYFNTVRKKVESLKLSNRVIYTGFLSDDDLVLLLNLATVLVLPSFLEGFGLPAVEAAACGLPVIATTASPLPEVLGEGGIFLDPNNKSGWRDCLLEVLSSEKRRQEMREAGISAAKTHTWEKAAFQLQGVLNKVTA